MSKPVEVVLRFRNKQERDYFMGQLSDGFGENECDLKWRGDFDRARVFHVDPTVSELWEHHAGLEARIADRLLGRGR